MDNNDENIDNMIDNDDDNIDNNSKSSDNSKNDPIIESQDMLGINNQEVLSSVAFSLIDELKRNNVILEEEADYFKIKYAQLYETVDTSHKRERTLLKRARTLNNEILSERIAMEKAKVNEAEELQNLKKIEMERDQTQKLLEDVEQKDTIVKYELADIQQYHDDLTQQIEDLKEENQRLVEPEFNKLRSSLATLEEEYSEQEKIIEKDQKRKEELTNLINNLEQENIKKENELEEVKQQLSKATIEPERVRRQAESVSKAAGNLKQEYNILKNKIQAYEIEMKKQNERRKETEDLKKDLNHKVRLHRDTLEHRENDMDILKNNLRQEKERNHELLTKRVEIDLKQKEIDMTLRHEVDSLGLIKKEYDIMKRRLKKKRQVVDGLKEILPQLESQLVDHTHTLRIHKEENEQYDNEIERLKQDVDLSIARLLEQESIEKGERDRLEGLVEEVEDMEEELSKWVIEERKQRKLITVLSTQRDLKSRESSRAKQSEKETKQQVKIKELMIIDLVKKGNEVNNRLEEFSALYDVVKNERNKYVNLIQSSNQALAEMKEKIKILQNEVEILRNESKSKDRALSKERAAHHASQVHRDNLRLETNRLQAEYRKRQNVVEQQIIEIDKLNSIINGLETDMLKLKTQYQNAIEARNMTGIQLIDRNDELCILYEKSNLQEETLKNGELNLQDKEEELKVLKLQRSELKRKYEISKKKVPKIDELENKIESLENELKNIREASTKLSENLEDPSNENRWRSIEGEDPDPEQLRAKIVLLESRLNSKRELIVEKDLILEELNILINKLRNQAEDGKEEAVELAKKVNTFQSKIRDISKKMMATVSELSMYQATAMKLQQEKHSRERDLEEVKWRFDNNEAPTEEIEREWMHMKNKMLQDFYNKMESQPRSDIPESLLPKQLPYTTAEPRLNAYIPDDLGIPKPYGKFAPFKPTDLGSSVRHIRNPNPIDIEI